MGDVIIRKILRFIIGAVGVLFRVGILAIMKSLSLLNIPNSGWKAFTIQLSFPLLIGIIFYLFSYRIVNGSKRIIRLIENKIQTLHFYDIVLGSIGLIIGLIIANLLSKPLDNMGIPYLGFIGQVILYGSLGYLGITIPTKKREDIFATIENTNLNRKTNKEKIRVSSSRGSYPKILDTSVIIDGRIADICKTGFIEGPLVIAGFVLDELQSIADSSDDLKRNRGRRGLDILNKIQKELKMEIIIHEEGFGDVLEVDSKLLKLTQLLKGKIVTNDYNLNKVAEIQGIEVLNINELANAIKPVVLPGEEMGVFVAKDGKEAGQGLAYLDDGTMIVIESDKRYIGETIDVVVTSVLQTST